ncbi:UNVERIFIED_CONTAM: dienelactone hydrolase [Brevibacillus sp. OAP136]
MLKIINQRANAIVVLHEIYGINAHMEEVCEQFAQAGFDVFCPNLLGREQPFGYDEEQAAYHNFVETVGFDHGYEQATELIRSLRDRYEHVIVAGYSIGATIAWRCSEQAGLCDGVVGYYGSRIRQYPDLQPACPVLLFLPSEEKAFDVRELFAVLQQKEIVKTWQLEGLHGCCDPHSAHFVPNAYEFAWEKTAAFIKTIAPGQKTNELL